MGLSGECPICAATLDLWVEIYGGEAGNMALRTVARGGIYVAGGIAVKVLSKIRTGKFTAAVKHKEKLEAFLSNIPIHVVLNEECPLLGPRSWPGKISDEFALRYSTGTTAMSIATVKYIARVEFVSVSA